MTEVLSPALFALLAAGSLVFGSTLPTVGALQSRLTAHRLAMLIGFSAGLMLATALHELLPEAIHKTHGNEATALSGAGIGFLLLYTIERLTHFHACRHRSCEIVHEGQAEVHSHLPGHAHSHVHTHTSTTLMGIGLHNFIDGLITAAAFAVSQVAGGLVLGAIVLHQLAVGFSLGALLLRAGTDRARIKASSAITGSFILWGVLAYAIFPVTETMSGFLLGVAGGSFLYIGACDLLPEAHQRDEGVYVMSATLLGYGGALLLKAVLPHH